MKPTYYSIIPAHVRYDKNLSPNAKLLYGEITSLTNQEGYCWATNSYFANIYGVSKVTVSRLINTLIEKGYLISRFKYVEGTKCIKERRLYVVDLSTAPINKIDDIPKSKYYDSININDKGPINKIVKDNNTSNNNKNNKYLFEPKQNCISKLKDFSIVYQENIGVINGIVAEELDIISKEIEVELFKEAIRIAIDKSKCNFGYIKGILNQWRKNNIKTLNDLHTFRIKNQKSHNDRMEVDICEKFKSKNKRNERSPQELAKELLSRKGKKFKDYL